MKAVLLEADAVNHNDLSWEPLTSLVETRIYGNTTEDNKYEHIGDADIVFLNKIRMDEEVFQRCPNIRYIGVCATGYNVIDTEACARHGVTVTNVPAYSTDSVAQLTWGMILEAVCHIGLHNTSVHNGDWVKSDIFCYWLAPVTELAGKTIGIVGYGNIGRRVCEIAEAFHMRVLVHTAHPEKYIEKALSDMDACYYRKQYENALKETDEESGRGTGSKGNVREGKDNDRFVDKDNTNARNTGFVGNDNTNTGNVEFVELDTLLSQSDIISLHCPLTEETEGIINKGSIGKMKDGVIIINVSRGGLMVERDLADALAIGKVAAAGVDVVSAEPMKEDNPLLSAPNITITPHMGWASVDARKRLVDVVADNFRAFLEGREENVVS